MKELSSGSILHVVWKGTLTRRAPHWPAPCLGTISQPQHTQRAGVWAALENQPSCGGREKSLRQLKWLEIVGQGIEREKAVQRWGPQRSVWRTLLSRGQELAVPVQRQTTQGLPRSSSTETLEGNQSWGKSCTGGAEGLPGMVTYSIPIN